MRGRGTPVHSTSTNGEPVSKRRASGEGGLHQIHAAGCPRPVDRHGNTACKCKWRGLLVVGYKPGAKPGTQRAVTKTVTRPTRSGAAVALRELREQHSANTLPIGKPPTLEQWLNVWHARHQKKNKERTRITYRGHIDNYLIPLLGHHRLDRLTSEDIEDAWETLLEHGNPLLGDKARPLSGTTVHNVHVTLRRALRVAMQKKKLAANPASPDAMDAPPKSDAEVEPLSTVEWQAVRDTAAGLDWNGARWTVALALGLRQGESLGLRWTDVDLDAGTLAVRQTIYRLPKQGLVFGKPKSKRSNRDMVMPGPLVAQLKAHRKAQTEARLLAGDHWTDSGLVFTYRDGRPIDPRQDRVHWAALLDAAGVEHTRLHNARHTAATMLLLQGVDQRVVMDIMGWSQVSTAANYQHAVAEAKRDAADKMGSAYWA